MRSSARSLSIIVPAYNEQARIATTIRELQRVVPSLLSEWEVRVVDDGSTDDTVRQAERAAAGDRRVVVQREPHRGKGGAVRAGMLAAHADLLFMCDADLSMAPEGIARFVTLVPEACDVAIASREVAGARRIGEPAHRHVMGRCFNWLVQVTTLPGIRDTQCGFKMYSAEAARAIFPRVAATGWAFDIEVLAIARQRHLRVLEVPVDWRYADVSRVSLARDTVGMSLELLAIRRRTGRMRRSS